MISGPHPLNNNVKLGVGLLSFRAPLLLVVENVTKIIGPSKYLALNCAWRLQKKE